MAIQDKLNNCSIFVLPVLGKHFSFFDPGFINCYLYEKDGLTDCVALVYNATTEEQDEKLRQLAGFLDIAHEDGYEIYIYSIPDEFVYDIEHFKKGRFSKFSEVYKQRVLRCSLALEQGNVKESKLYGIMYKKNSMKKYWFEMLGEEIPDHMEYWSIPDETVEILK